MSEWSVYFAALKGRSGVVSEANPETGFWRHRSGAPIAIWRASGAVVMLLDGAVVDDPAKQGRFWIEAAKHPVLKASYDGKIATGMWPDELPAVKPATAPTAAAAEQPESAPSAEAVTDQPGETAERGPGDNSKNLTEYQRMRAEFLGDAAEATAYYAKNQITTKEAADKAQDWGSRLLRAARAADEARLAENKPLRDQIAENDKKWRQIIEGAETAGKKAQSLADAWGKAEVARLRKEAEEQAQREWEAEQAKRKAEHEAELAARAKELAEAAARGEPAEPPPPDELGFDLPQAPPPKPIVETPKLMLGTGREGNRRAASTKQPMTAAIVDLKAAVDYLVAQSNADLIALVQTIANKAVKAGTPMPGTKAVPREAA